MVQPGDTALVDAYEWPTQQPGVLSVHAASCGVRDGQACSCGPLGYRASRQDPVAGRQVSPLLGSAAAAHAWTEPGTRNGHAPQRAAADTIGDRIDDFLAAAADGRARDPQGRRYAQADLAELDVALHGHVAVELGEMPLTAVRRWQVQAFVNELADSGLSLRRLRAIVAALRAFFLFAIEEGAVRVNPVEGVLVPTEEHDADVTGDARRPFTTTDQLAAVKTGGGGDGMIPDQMLWQFVKIATVIFVLIALVLVAESV